MKMAALLPLQLYVITDYLSVQAHKPCSIFQLYLPQHQINVYSLNTIYKNMSLCIWHIYTFLVIMKIWPRFWCGTDMPSNALEIT